MNLKLVPLFALFCGSSLTGLASTHVGIGVSIGLPAPVIVRQAPPPRVSEIAVQAPGPGYVWVAGHYSWNNAQWLWVPGAWVNPPQPGAVWVDGRWDASTQTWTEAHWEISRPISPPPTVAPAVVVAPAPAPDTIIITTPPPPLRHEMRGHRPGRGYVWISGYWGVDRGHQVWVSGHWTIPPRGYHGWVEPRWERRGGAYVFIEGHWR